MIFGMQRALNRAVVVHFTIVGASACTSRGVTIVGASAARGFALKRQTVVASASADLTLHDAMFQSTQRSLALSSSLGVVSLPFLEPSFEAIIPNDTPEGKEGDVTTTSGAFTMCASRLARGLSPHLLSTVEHTTAASNLFNELRKRTQLPLFLTFRSDVDGLRSSDAQLLSILQPEALSRLRVVFDLNTAAVGTTATAFPFDSENCERWQEAMLSFAESLYPLPQRHNQTDGPLPDVSSVYLYAVGHSARVWAADLARLEEGNFSSRMVNGQLVPWSFVLALKAASPLINRYIQDGRETSTVYIFYIGMTDARNPYSRLLAHGTSSGCDGTREVYRRLRDPLCFSARGNEIPIIIRRIIAPTARGSSVSAGRGALNPSPAAKLEMLLGATTLTIGGLRASFCTSSQGDTARLFDVLERKGRRIAQPRALAFLSITARDVDIRMAGVEAEQNLHMRTHLEEACRISILLRPERLDQPTLYDAYCLLLTRKTVDLVVKKALKAKDRGTGKGKAMRHSKQGTGT